MLVVMRGLFILGLVGCVAACGRIDFDPAGGGNDANRDGVPAMTGPRWIRSLGSGSRGLLVAGANGEVTVSAGFKTMLAIEGATFAGLATYVSAGIVRYDRAGAIRSTSVLDATYMCDIRDLAMVGDDALAVGIAHGLATPAVGACGVATSGDQDPIGVRVDAAGGQHLVAHWPSAGANAQAWTTTAFADGTIAMAGVYGDALTIGTALPAAGNDPNVFLTRFAEAAPMPMWGIGMSAPVRAYAGPLAADGEELCTLGSFDGVSTVFGTALPFVANRDAWVGRLRGTGAARFVRAVGTTGRESTNASGSIVPTDDGGCIASMYAPGTLVLDGINLPSGTGDAVILRFDGAGTAVTGVRTTKLIALARAGTRLIGAIEVDAPLSLIGGTYTPEGVDVAIIELDDSGPTRVLGVIGGTGTQTLDDFAAIADDAVVIAISSIGPLTFGTSASDSGTQVVHLVATFGL